MFALAFVNALLILFVPYYFIGERHYSMIKSSYIVTIIVVAIVCLILGRFYFTKLTGKALNNTIYAFVPAIFFTSLITFGLRLLILGIIPILMATVLFSLLFCQLGARYDEEDKDKRNRTQQIIFYIFGFICTAPPLFLYYAFLTMADF